MRASKSMFLICLLLWFAIASVAQQPQVQDAATSSPGAPAPRVLKEGTEVPLKFAQPLSSKTARVGDSVEFTLAEDVKLGDAVVIPKETRAVGTVTHAKKNGMMGKAGELNLSIDYVKLGDKRVKLRGTQGREGDSKVGATVALVAVFGVLGFMKHGKNVEVKAGDPLKAYIAEDTEVTAVR
jgi:hypothetical protein